MDSSDINHKLLTSYLRLLENLNNESKLELIARLNDSIKADRQAIDERFTRAFGGWSKDDVAEEIINTIRGSRQQNRTNESL